MASKISDTAARSRALTKRQLSGSVEEDLATAKDKDLAALGAPPKAVGNESVASDDMSSDTKRMIAKLLLSAGSSALGGLFGGSAGAAAGAQSGEASVNTLNNLEASERREGLDKLAIEATRKEKVERAKIDAGELERKVAHDKEELRLKGIELGLKSQEKPGKPLASEQSDRLASYESASESLKDLTATAGANDDILGPVAGRLAGINPYNTGAKAVEARFKTVAQNIGKALESGKMTDGDRAFYLGILPTMTDTPEVINAKANQLQRMIAQQQSSALTTFAKAGSNVAGFTPMQLPELQQFQDKKIPGRINALSIENEAVAAPPADYNKLSYEQLVEEAKKRGLR